MVTAAWDTSNLVALEDGSGLACTNCCGEPGLPDPNEMEAICARCVDTQPLKVRLDFSNFQDADPGVCTLASGTGRAAHFPQGTTALLGNGLILDFVSGCLYLKDIVVDYDRDIYSTGDCSDEPSVRNSQVLRITAVGNPGKLTIIIQYLDADQDVVFVGEISYSGDPCFGTNNTVNNTHIGGPCSISGIVLTPATGTVGITI